MSRDYRCTLKFSLKSAKSASLNVELMGDERLQKNGSKDWGVESLLRTLILIARYHISTDSKIEHEYMGREN
ncbi:MAG: hypothetical protein QXV32_03310 [Conexivisphaerales archaeon]